MSFFRYPGGKSKLRNVITSQLIQQTGYKEIEYREPFFGSGSICFDLISKYKHISKVWINDKDIGIACLWTSVIQHPKMLKELVVNFEPSIEQFDVIREELINLKTMPESTDSICLIGFKKLAIHQISYSGLGTKSGGPLGGRKQESRYKIDCRWSPDYICRSINKLNATIANRKIHASCCTNLDFSELLNDDRSKSLLYLDPPYYINGNSLYQEGFTLGDHVRLAEALQVTEHKWVLSYDDCEEIRGLYDWAYITPLETNYTITATKDKITGKCRSRDKTELLIYPQTTCYTIQ